MVVDIQLGEWLYVVLVIGFVQVFQVWEFEVGLGFYCFFEIFVVVLCWYVIQGMLFVCVNSFKLFIVKFQFVLSVNQFKMAGGVICKVIQLGLVGFVVLLEYLQGFLCLFNYGVY